MTYTAKQFASELLAQLDQGYDPIRIARWADSVFFATHAVDCSPAIRSALTSLFTMQEGEEFVISEADLRKLAHTFANS